MGQNDEIIKQLRKVISDEMGKIKESIELAKEEIKEENRNEMKELRKEIEKSAATYREMHKEVNDLKEENERMQQRIDDLEQYSRIANVIIRGIKEAKDEAEEELVECIQEIGKSLGVELESGDINTIHRMPTKKGIRPVIVRLNNRMKKSRLVKRSRECELEAGIKIYNHLTNKSMEILNAARDVRAEGAIQFVWETNGKILIRKDENSQATRITSVDQLKKYRRTVSDRTKTRSKSRSEQAPNQTGSSEMSGSSASSNFRSTRKNQN